MFVSVVVVVFDFSVRVFKLLISEEESPGKL